MAATLSIAGLRAQLWYKQLFDDVSKWLFMSRFMGDGANNPVQVVRDLTTKPGKTINIGLSTKLSGSGITGDSTLEGQEEAISSYAVIGLVDQLRHAVIMTGKMDEKLVAYNMRQDAKEKLAIWWAERIDQEILDKLCGKTSATFANTPTNPSTNRAVWAGGQTADTGLTASHVFDTKVLDKAKQVAIMATVKVRPIRMSDEQYKGTAKYFCIVHPYQASDLRKDPVWNQAQRDANDRGPSNPVLSGALGEYNGIIVYQHEGIYQFAGGAASANIARAVLMGQQAAVFMEGAEEEWVEKEFDYGNQWGISAGRIFGVIKPRFNSQDYGVVTIATGADVASTA